MIQTITAIIETLKGLFADKGELKGFDDWDSLIGCVMALENIRAELQSYETAGEETAAEETAAEE